MIRDEEWLLNEKYLGERSEEFFNDCERLKNGEPLAYVIGHIPFLDTTIYLDSHPLIPRPETEYWVDKVIEKLTCMNPPHFRSRTPKMRVLDMCAGSGCIGMAVAKALPHTRVDFVEIDTSHHPTIMKNVRANDIEESRVRIVGGDLFEHVTGTYDYIFSNPPYIDRTLNRTDSSVLEHEPHKALFADNAGFALVERIMREALSHLTQNGIVVIEHEPEHTTRIRELAQNLGYHADSQRDQYGVLRYTFLARNKSESV